MKEKNLKILVIGESCIDQFVYCNTNRLSPEAPVPVLNPVYTTENSGMAGNVYENVCALDLESDVILCYQDEDIIKRRYIDVKSNHMFLRVDTGEDKITEFDYSENITQQIKEADLVIVSDYNKGFLNNHMLWDIGHLAKISILDTKRKLSQDVANKYSFIKLNEGEAKNNSHLNSKNIITTLGKRGAKYKDVIFESFKPQDTIDVSGAGDTFTAAFIIKYYQSKDISDAIKFANHKAAEVVSKRGVVIPGIE
jgi:D-beta-D-heptose 7-phosphate kinase/D-beta-D-heptose 1-phosphate adenosyltransferase